MLTTRVRPIIRAAAVAEVRRGLRIAFCSPARRAGRAARAGADRRRQRTDGERQRDHDTDERGQQAEPEDLHAARRRTAQTSMAAAPATRVRAPMTARRFDGFSRARGRLAQRLDRQHLRGPAGRDEGGDDRDDGADEQGDPDGARLELERGARQGEADRVHQRVQALGDARARGRRRPRRRATPSSTPRAAGSASPGAGWRRSARSSAISRDRWVTIIVNVFQMMKEPTNRAMPAKIMNRMRHDLEVLLHRVGVLLRDGRSGDGLGAVGQQRVSRLASSAWLTRLRRSRRSRRRGRGCRAPSGRSRCRSTPTWCRRGSSRRRSRRCRRR